jgi:hypothetical protein
MDAIEMKMNPWTNGDETMQALPADDLTIADEVRFREIARIFAAGILRLRARSPLPTEPGAKNLPESAQKSLEVSEKMVLSVSHGS